MAKQRGRGRPTKLTPDIIADIHKLIQVLPFETSIAAYLRIDPRTFYNWRKRGEHETSGLYHDFFLTVAQAKATLEITLLTAIRRGDRDWKAKAWIAERAFQEHWGRRVDISLRRERSWRPRSWAARPTS